MSDVLARICADKRAHVAAAQGARGRWPRSRRPRPRPSRRAGFAPRWSATAAAGRLRA